MCFADRLCGSNLNRKLSLPGKAPEKRFGYVFGREELAVRQAVRIMMKGDMSA